MLRQVLEVLDVLDDPPQSLRAVTGRLGGSPEADDERPRRRSADGAVDVRCLLRVPHARIVTVQVQPGLASA